MQQPARGEQADEIFLALFRELEKLWVQVYNREAGVERRARGVSPDSVMSQRV